MDTAFFRFLGPELIDALRGVRIDTVYCPAQNCWTIAFSPPVTSAGSVPPGFSFLLARIHSRDGVIFLSPVKPVNPPAPKALVMWLRKRLKWRKVTGGAADWPRKRLALELSPGEGRYLLLSMEDDPVVLDRLPEDFCDAPSWASAAMAYEDPSCPRSVKRALEREEPEDRDRLVAAFLAGRAAGFYMDQAAPMRDGPLPWPASRQSERFASAVEAAGAYGQLALFGALAPPDEAVKKARVKLKKRLANLDKDRERLDGMAGLHRYGETLAASLSALEPRSRSGPLELVHPEHGAMTVPLDPSMTILENMERFFRRAAKGRRGLVHVERLRAEAEAQAAAAQAGQAGQAGRGVLEPGASGRGRGQAVLALGASGRKAPSGEARRASPGKGAPGGAKAGAGKHKDIPLRRFRSSDGFAILRGKNASANHKLLSDLVSPFDYWLHAEGGPGAHVIVKRDHPNQAVPERTLNEAAQLAALASWRAGDGKAAVLVAECRDVRKFKGAALGQVRVASAATLTVELDPGLEEKLAADG
jgi:predicted ribosome quality control (RQC) complex YloA/Tae2 family protein